MANKDYTIVLTAPVLIALILILAAKELFQGLIEDIATANNLSMNQIWFVIIMICVGVILLLGWSKKK